jgi:outer membrane receptor protein involved in Fe transport
MGVTLDVRNATDATPWLPASSEYRQDLIPGVGREIAIGARIRF